MDIVLELIKLGSVGVLAGAFASLMANRDHRQQKWWELRIQAYKEVIEALSELLQYFDTYLNATVAKEKLTEDQKNELLDIRKNGFQRVRRAADAGAFMFSTEVEDALNELVSESNISYLTFYDQIYEGWASTRKCLDVLVKCSKNDLQLKSTFIDQG